MSCAILSDDLWIAEKFQSNLAIAGSRRNSLRVSLMLYVAVVEHCQGSWGSNPPDPCKLRMLLRFIMGVRMWGLSSIFERETAQPVV